MQSQANSNPNKGSMGYFVGSEKPMMGPGRENCVIMEADEESYCQNESPVNTTNNRSKNHGKGGQFSLSPPSSKQGTGGAGGVPVNL
jgi:hypothetical protein